MKTFARYAVEVIAAAWVVLVAVQYLSRYFVSGLDLDLTWAYACMAALTAVFGGLRLRKKTG